MFKQHFPALQNLLFFFGIIKRKKESETFVLQNFSSLVKSYPFENVPDVYFRWRRSSALGFVPQK